MNEIATDIKKLQDETLRNLKNSKSLNTVRAYKSDFEDFSLFCVKNGFNNLPSEPKVVSLYLTHLSTRDSKISTIKRRLVSIGVIHKMKGHYLDTKASSNNRKFNGYQKKKRNISKRKKTVTNQ